ncbi:ENV1 protein, partial [Trogon melanurus]|nr:ENV1 protein [Trogon melanurus]
PKVNSLWNIMKASYRVLNQTYPNLTKHCWLCFDPKPPYYEAIGIDGSFRIVDGSNPPQCRWEENKQGISLQHVTGKGTCIG